MQHHIMSKSPEKIIYSLSNEARVFISPKVASLRKISQEISVEIVSSRMAPNMPKTKDIKVELFDKVVNQPVHLDIVDPICIMTEENKSKVIE